jgi:hypothetical protein
MGAGAFHDVGEASLVTRDRRLDVRRAAPMSNSRKAPMTGLAAVFENLPTTRNTPSLTTTPPALAEDGDNVGRITGRKGQASGAVGQRCATDQLMIAGRSLMHGRVGHARES